jgi:PPOX class probable F420-dependent enzyme
VSAAIPEQFNQIIEQSEFAWFTTVREDGMPQPTPVWYVRDGDTFLLYSEPGAQKVKNIRANPKVALGVANDDAGDYFVVQGEAAIDETVPPANKMPAYIQKYLKSIAEIGFTPETFIQRWSLPIRVKPIHVRGEIE